MGFVLLFFGITLLFVAWRAEDRATRIAMLLFAALNLFAFADMAISRHEYTWKLAPPEEGPPEPAWRR
jgi:hypothetical protein